MAEIDGSIPASAGKVPNMMQSLGEMATAMGAMNANRLFMAKQAAGQAVQAAIGPDGQLDPAKLNQLIAQNPRIAPYASEALTQSLAQQGAGIANTGAGLSLQAAQGDRVRAMIGTLGPNATHDQVLGALSLLAQTRQIKDDFAANVAGNIPADPAQIGAWAKNNFVLPALGAEGALNAANPKPTAVNIGGKTLLVATPNAGFGSPSQEGEIDNTLSPEAKATRQTVVGPNGQPRSVPLSALTTDTGEPKIGPLTGPHGEVSTALSPSGQAAAGVSGQQNAQMATALTQRVSKVRDNKAILGNMEGLLDNFMPGPQSGFFKNLNQLATQYGLAKPGSAPQTMAAAQEEFGKLAFQLAQTQFQALGGTGTDAKLENTMHTSPSELLTRYGSKGIIALLKGNEDAVQAQSNAWQKWQDAGHGAETYSKFLNQWNRVYDPRVFQSVYQTPEARRAALKGMSAAEQKQFQTDYKRAVGLGWITP